MSAHAQPHSQAPRRHQSTSESTCFQLMELRRLRDVNFLRFFAARASKSSILQSSTKTKRRHVTTRCARPRIRITLKPRKAKGLSSHFSSSNGKASLAAGGRPSTWPPPGLLSFFMFFIFSCFFVFAQFFHFY